MRNHGDVKKSDEGQPEHDWRSGVKNANAYVKFKNEFVNKLSDFEYIRDVDTGQNNISKHQIVLSLADLRGTHYAPYGAGPEAPEFEKQESDRTLWERGIESTQTVWTGPTVFEPKENCPLRVCVKN